jgi:tetratricopeptide (TPR) repeat protein
MLPLRFYIFPLLLLCPAFSALVCAQTHPDPNLTLKQALQLTREHRYAEAEAVLKGINPPADAARKIAFYRLKAAIASGLGHFEAAAQDMSAAALLSPENQDLRIAANMARLQAQAAAHKDVSATLKGLRSEELSTPQAVDMRLRIAEILTRANLFSEAATDFALAATLAPDRGDLQFNLALAQFRAGSLDAALASAQRAKALEDTASVESLIGDIQEKRGDALAAVHSYQAAVTLEPSEERYRLALGLELLRHQTFDAALVVFNQASTLFPRSVRVKILLGLTYYFVDRSADAIHALMEATQQDPHDQIAQRYLGEITLQDASAPDRAAAAQVCRFADEVPQNKTADAYCGAILLRLARDNADDSRRTEIMRRLQHAARLAPREPLARCQLGKAFEWTEQWTQARSEMEVCVRLDPNSPDGHYQLSRIYRRLGMTSLASKQVSLQEAAALRQNEESVRHTETVAKFLVLLEQ